MLEGLKDSQKFFVVGVIVEFHGIEGAGMEGDWVKFAVGGVNGQNGICLDHDLGVWHPVHEYWCMCELLLELVECCVAFAIKVPWSILPCQTSKGSGDFRVSADEPAVEIGKAKE